MSRRFESDFLVDDKQTFQVCKDIYVPPRPRSLFLPEVNDSPPPYDDTHASKNRVAGVGQMGLSVYGSGG